MGTFSLHFVEALLIIGVPRERAQSLAELLERGIDERYSLHAEVLATTPLAPSNSPTFGRSNSSRQDG